MLPRRERTTIRVRALPVTLALLGACASSCGAPEDGTVVEEITVCPGANTVLGVDVSEFQGTINWASVKSSGRHFAIARIGDGTYRDPTFARNWSGIRAAGMIRGAYQFFRPNDDPTTQANIVVNAVGQLGDGDLPVVADVEVSGGESAATIVSRLRTWLARVEAGTGKRPMIYTAQYFWNSSVGGSSAFSTYPLWVANYGVSCPNMPTGWSRWRIWQYTSTGSISGISGNVDHDRFDGTLAQLQAFAGAPAYGGQFVSQSFPFASQGAIQIHAGQTQSVSITMKNIGTATWNSNTRLATTVPRDRTSVFADSSWVMSDRPDAVSGTVAPGANYRFTFVLHAPMTTGRYDEHFGMVQDGVTWFSAAGQGGPPDNQLEALIDVLPPVAPPDAGTPDAGTRDATVGDATMADARMSDARTDVTATDVTRGDAFTADGSRSDGSAGDGSRGDASIGMDGGEAQMPAGCQCSTPGGTRGRGRSQGAIAALAIASIALGARRKKQAS